ncbi:MAG: winged helix-turn-helix domain-containing protein [Rhodospirillales bacterium]|nr:winged helix-turn-helix domain-containing protein [Rhodospirillales bacterium]
MIPVINNSDARRLFMHLQGLSASPSRKIGKDGVLEMIESMGFVQVDSINTVERAHHMILFSRNQTYRQKYLSTLLERDRALFENWTHDASIVPTRFYPYWRHRFVRREPVLRERRRKWGRDGFQGNLDQVLGHVRDHGPVRSRDMQAPRDKGIYGKGSDGWWDWHPSKTALEFLWQTGSLAVDRREGFQKVYDLSERVIPANHLNTQVGGDDFAHWACSAALDRLGFATAGELAAFWDIISPSEAKCWCDRQNPKDLIQVDIESADGSKPRRAFARPDVMEQAQDAPTLPSRMRVLSPFDPVLRDRKRALRLFNFHYRIEVFVPEPQRQYGYYVFPLLEGERLVGRIDMKCDRKQRVLSVTGLWPEQGVTFSKGRLARLESELERMRRFTDMDHVVFLNGFLNDSKS